MLDIRQKKTAICYLCLLLFVGMAVPMDGFSIPRISNNNIIRSSSSSGINNNNNNNNNNIPPPHDQSNGFFHPDDDDDDDSDPLLWSLFFTMENDDDDDDDCDMTVAENHAVLPLNMRGGSTKTTSTDDLRLGSASTWRTSVDYWSRFVQNFKQRLSFGGQKKQKVLTKEEQIIRELQQMKIKRVRAPNSTILTLPILTRCGHASHLISNPMTPEKVQLLAKHIKQYYISQGHVLASVTCATLNGDTATVELATQEPKVNAVQPIHLQFVKAMIQHPNNPSQLISYRQYHKEHKMNAKYSAAASQPSLVPLKDCNVTYVPISTGTTNPSKLAKALNLQPRKSFCWDGSLFQKTSRRFFNQILQASPRRMNDGSVQLYLVGEELPFRNLEYGLSNNLYTGQWEGELQVEHTNLFGGGEQLNFNMKKDGTTTMLPSLSLQYTRHPLDSTKNNKGRGHAIRLFHESIASTMKKATIKTQPLPNDADDDTVEYQEIPTTDTQDDGLLTRRGGTVTIWNPIKNVAASTAAAERVLARDGNQESILSTNMQLGPYSTSTSTNYRNSLRANIQSTCTIGSRWLSSAIENKSNSAILLPYSIFSATARQIVPLTKKIEIGLLQQLQTSSRHLPRHEANAMGIASRIRGLSSSSTPLYQSIQTTSELRVPLPSFENISVLKFPTRLLKNTSVLFFHDYRIGTPYTTTSSSTALNNEIQSSVGMGIRKSVQGLPLKYDISYNLQDKNVRAFFGLGHDFNVQ